MAHYRRRSFWLCKCAFTYISDGLLYTRTCLDLLINKIITFYLRFICYFCSWGPKSGPREKCLKGDQKDLILAFAVVFNRGIWAHSTEGPRVHTLAVHPLPQEAIFGHYMGKTELVPWHGINTYPTYHIRVYGVYPFREEQELILSFGQKVSTSFKVAKY
jgi:hypothetical protein